MVVIEKKWMHSGKSWVNRAKWFYSDNMVVFGQKWLYSGKSDCIRAKVVLFEQKWLYSGNSGFIWPKKGSIGAKVVVIGQGCCF